VAVNPLLLASAKLFRFHARPQGLAAGTRSHGRLWVQLPPSLQFLHRRLFMDDADWRKQVWGLFIAAVCVVWLACLLAEIAKPAIPSPNRSADQASDHQ
jgi:hypothetical protein